MSSKSSIKKYSLARRIEDEGFVMVFPCTRCARLHKTCIKSEGSDRCSECIKTPGTKCVDSETTFSDKEWRRLVAAQSKIEEERRATLAKLLRLESQNNLLRRRAGDFIARDIKEIEELEKLEEDEAIERKRLAEEQAKQVAEQEQQELIAAMLNPSDASGLVAGGSSWLAAFSSPNQSFVDIPESYRGNSDS
jgi:hypothetical protein